MNQGINKSDYTSWMRGLSQECKVILISENESIKYTILIEFLKNLMITSIDSEKVFDSTHFSFR